MAGPLILEAWKYSNEKGELSREQLLSTIMLLEKSKKHWVPEQSQANNPNKLWPQDHNQNFCKKNEQSSGKIIH